MKNVNMKKINHIDQYTRRLLWIFVVIVAVLSIMKTDKFLTLNSFQSIFLQFPQYGLMVFGVMLTLMSGGIDLSVVGIANLTGIVAALILIHAPNLTPGVVILSIVCALVVGFIAGALNGIMIAKFGIPAILCTLSTNLVFRGVAIVLTEGKSLSGLPAQITEFGNAMFLNVVPYLFIIYLICALGIGILLKKTVYGERLIMVGTNQTCARFSGIKVKTVLIQTYILSGICATLGGLVLTMRTGAARADYGTQYQLQSMLIAILAGVNPNGGEGKVLNVFIATIILQVLATGLNMFPQISNFYKYLIWGTVLLLVLVMNKVLNKKKIF